MKEYGRKLLYKFFVPIPFPSPPHLLRHGWFHSAKKKRKHKGGIDTEWNNYWHKIWTQRLWERLSQWSCKINIFSFFPPYYHVHAETFLSPYDSYDHLNWYHIYVIRPKDPILFYVSPAVHISSVKRGKPAKIQHPFILTITSSHSASIKIHVVPLTQNVSSQKFSFLLLNGMRK